MENLTISAHQDKKKAETEQEQAETLQLTNRKKLNKFSKHAMLPTPQCSVRQERKIVNDWAECFN